MESKYCKHKCGCNQRLITIGSNQRDICSDCILGNCRGMGLLTLKELIDAKNTKT